MYQMQLSEETIFGAGEKGIEAATHHKNPNDHNKDVNHPIANPHYQETSVAKFSELFKNKQLQTITYCSVFWSFGLCVAFLGPTLPDLQCMVSSVLNDVSWVFFAQALFTLIGAALAGLVETRFGNNNTLLVSTTMIGVTLAVIPLCQALWSLAVVLAVMGYFMGMIDTVANMSMIKLYGPHVAPFLQALHFCYGLGAFVSPMVVQPFVRESDCEDVKVLSHRRHMIHRNYTYITDDEDQSKIKYAFWILAGLQIPIILLILWVIVRVNVSQKRERVPNTFSPIVSGKDKIEMTTKDGSTSEPEDIPAVTLTQVCKITSCIGLILFIYDGLQAGYGGYIFSYATRNSSVVITPNSAAYLNAYFWGTFAFGRLVSIWISTLISPLFMLLGNISGCFISMVLLLVLERSSVMLYVGTCLFGLFMSSVYPTAITLAEMYIPVTTKITSVLVSCAAMGEMALPVAIGHVFYEFGPISLLVFGVLMTVLSFMVYVVLFLFGQNIVRHSADLSLIGRLQNIVKKTSRPVNEDSGVMTHHTKSYKRMKSDVSEAWPDGNVFESTPKSPPSTF